MRPTIVDRIIHSNGTIDVNTPKVVEQVITPEAAETVTAMLVSTAERGYAKAGAVPRYKIAAKTGTSQIARPGGGYESGTGATIASFFGYAPVNNPRFIILVKIDRPQYREVVHGAAAAAPVFKDIASFLFKYYGIPPDAR
jgi:cell division protein FtsI/penicillin-binding protein 2